MVALKLFPQVHNTVYFHVGSLIFTLIFSNFAQIIISDNCISACQPFGYRPIS